MLIVTSRSTLLIGALALALRPAALHGQLGATVRTTSGMVAGAPAGDSGVVVFRGLPYAAPPVGALRWRAPEPPASWEGVRPSGEFAAGCIQRITRSRPPWTEEFMHPGEVSEDCLYLNVWTAAASPAERRPVLVYIHGGGFNEGSGSVPIYDGSSLAGRGPVVVTLNYRLGVFGFLAHPALSAESSRGGSGNYGLLDQIAALRWVRDNIAAFGGDPSRVTLAGQSAGANSVYLLSASPLAKGLFHGIIAQSGPGALASFGLATTAALAQPRESAEAAGAAFAAARGATTAAELRALAVDRLTGAVAGGGGTPRWGAVIDGVFLPSDVPSIYERGEQNDVPMLMGLNADEGSASPGYGSASAADLRAYAEERYAAGAARFLELYPASDDETAGRVLEESARDAAIVALGNVAAERVQSGEEANYLYLLARAIPWPQRPEFGAFHTSEVPYVFDNLHLLERPWTAADRRIAQAMAAYWVNFVATGDPNGGGLPDWLPFREAPHALFVFDEEVGMRTLPAPERREFLEGHPLPNRR